MEVDEAQHTRVVRIPHFLNEKEIAQIHELGSELLQDASLAEMRYDAGMFPVATEEAMRMLRTFRSFGRQFPALASQIRSAASRAEKASKILTACGVEVRSDGSSAWHVAYLQVNSLLVSRLPELMGKIRAAVRDADHEEGWCLLDEDVPWNNVNVRVAEYHRHRAPSAGLPDAHHYDDKSLVTVDILLTDRDHFQGGEFRTLEADGRFSVHALHEAGDALIFVSHKYHSVAPITKGERRVLVLEFWRGPARQCPHRCAELSGSCPLEAVSSPQPGAVARKRCFDTRCRRDNLAPVARCEASHTELEVDNVPAIS